MPSMISSLESETLPTAADVEAAAQRIADKAVETPLLESPALNERLGGRIFLKPESLQRTGSFKFRGAYNKLKRLVEQKAARGGVVAFSSGNHAQGVAAAAALLGIKAVIVMPSDAPAIKLANTRGYGAEVVLYDRAREDREAIADKLAADRGAAIVRPFDDPDIIAGQGTVGLEIYRQSKARGVDLDAVLIPAGGGGLISGSSLALKAGWPPCPSMPASLPAMTIRRARWPPIAAWPPIPPWPRSATGCSRPCRASSPSPSTTGCSPAASPSATRKC